MSCDELELEEAMLCAGAECSLRSASVSSRWCSAARFRPGFPERVACRAADADQRLTDDRYGARNANRQRLRPDHVCKPDWRPRPNLYIIQCRRNTLPVLFERFAPRSGVVFRAISATHGERQR